MLEIVEDESPTPGDGEVLVSTEAIGVNFPDSVVRMGLYDSAKKLIGWPITPGFEFAGRVKDLGRGAGGLEVGERVMGVTLFGGYATEIVVPVAQVFSVPETWSMSQAATFHVVFLTAWYALRELAGVRSGAEVLIHSAAGGVGQAATQLACAFDCVVTGVVGTSEKVEAARAAGAHRVIDRSTKELWAAAGEACPRGFDVVLDANGAATLRQSYEHLRPSGRLVCYGAHSMLVRGRGRPNWLKLVYDYLRTPRFNPLEMTNANKSVLAFNLSYLFDRLDLLAIAHADLMGLVRSGKIRPLPVTDFPFEQVAEAQRTLESGTSTGKLCLVV